MTGSAMQATLMDRLIMAAATAIAAHADQLTRLDQAIGDGDHGANMRRGFDAVADARQRISAEPLGKALESVGMVLVMKVGGASGPLYGSLFMAMGRAAADRPLTVGLAVAMVEAGVQAVMQRGKAQPGEKTMLDVLVPVMHALDIGVAEEESRLVMCARLRQAADAGLAATQPMRATKGRASYLGERSIGHLDPGARSTCLLVHAVCDVLEGRA